MRLRCTDCMAACRWKVRPGSKLVVSCGAITAKGDVAYGALYCQRFARWLSLMRMRPRRRQLRGHHPQAERRDGHDEHDPRRILHELARRRCAGRQRPGSCLLAFLAPRVRTRCLTPAVGVLRLTDAVQLRQGHADHGARQPEQVCASASGRAARAMCLTAALHPLTAAALDSSRCAQARTSGCSSRPWASCRSSAPCWAASAVVTERKCQRLPARKWVLTMRGREAVLCR